MFSTETCTRLPVYPFVPSVALLGFLGLELLTGLATGEAVASIVVPSTVELLTRTFRSFRPFLQNLQIMLQTKA